MATINRNTLSPKQTTNYKSNSYKYYSSYYNLPQWKGLRDTKLRESPICECCNSHGYIREATEVHHIIPWTRGRDERHKQELFFNYDNLMSLCNKCHKLIHKKDDGSSPLNILSDNEYEIGHNLRFLK